MDRIERHYYLNQLIEKRDNGRVNDHWNRPHDLMIFPAIALRPRLLHLRMLLLPSAEQFGNRQIPSMPKASGRSFVHHGTGVVAVEVVQLLANGVTTADTLRVVRRLHFEAVPAHPGKVRLVRRLL